MRCFTIEGSDLNVKTTLQMRCGTGSTSRATENYALRKLPQSFAVKVKDFLEAV